jgi:hypothetical protein
MKIVIALISLFVGGMAFASIISLLSGLYQSFGILGGLISAFASIMGAGLAAFLSYWGLHKINGTDPD